MNKIRAIITGATGMVGEGVLHECLCHPDVESVLILVRRSSGYSHPKLREIIHSNFYDLSPLKNQLSSYNACFFCLGVSSLGMNEAEYTRVTYDLTMHVAKTLCGLNKNMVFCYVSGMGTDRTEKGKIMWARVKGKTENDLGKLPFKAAYAFRPGFLKSTKGLKYTLPYYKFVGWLFPILKPVFPKYMGTLRELGQAMIHVTKFNYPKTILNVKDIRELAEREQVCREN